MPEDQPRSGVGFRRVITTRSDSWDQQTAVSQDVLEALHRTAERTAKLKDFIAKRQEGMLSSGFIVVDLKDSSRGPSPNSITRIPFLPKEVGVEFTDFFTWNQDLLGVFRLHKKPDAKQVVTASYRLQWDEVARLASAREDLIQLTEPTEEQERMGVEALVASGVVMGLIAPSRELQHLVRLRKISSLGVDLGPEPKDALYRILRDAWNAPA